MLRRHWTRPTDRRRKRAHHGNLTDTDDRMTITRKLALHRGDSVWMAYPRRSPKAETTQRNIRTDILVVGAGISGALVAYLLADDGRRVTVVDRRGLVVGSTLASTALLQFELDMPL